MNVPTRTSPNGDVLAGRLNAGIPEGVLRSALTALRDCFGERWLVGRQAHPVRDLWGRQDFLATNELYWLGDAIVRLRAIDPTWVTRTIDQIRSDARNVRTGHMFELLMLGALATEEQRVRPTAMGMPNFDADLFVEGGVQVRLSLKNFGAPVREQEFEKRSGEIRRAILLARSGYPWTGAVIACNRYPSSMDWTTLSNGIRHVPLGTPGQYRIDEAWVCIVTPPLPNLDARHPSSAFFIAAPFHQNERKNFLDKISRECAKVNVVAGSYDSQILSMVVFRLGESAPFATYVAWAKDFMQGEHVDLAGLIFYQSAVVVNPETDVSQLHHHVDVAWRPGLSMRNIRITVPVGVPSPTPARSELVADGRRLSLDGHHWYQRQEIFRAAHGDLARSISGTIRRFPGISEHSVFDLGCETMVLSHRQPAVGQVTLFT